MSITTSASSTTPAPIQNIAGNNTLSGIIQLNGQAGFGVEQFTPPVPGEEPSQLVLTGYTWDSATGPGGITKLGSRRLVIQSPGTFTGDVDIKAGVLLAQNDTRARHQERSRRASTARSRGSSTATSLNGSFNDTLGGPPLADNGGTLNHQLHLRSRPGPELSGPAGRQPLLDRDGLPPR